MLKGTRHTGVTVLSHRARLQLDELARRIDPQSREGGTSSMENTERGAASALVAEDRCDAEVAPFVVRRKLDRPLDEASRFVKVSPLCSSLGAEVEEFEHRPPGV